MKRLVAPQKSHETPQKTLLIQIDGRAVSLAGRPLGHGFLIGPGPLVGQATAFLLELKRSEGTIDALYSYWMLGGAAQIRKPRWSVIRDVLGWVD